MKRRSPQAKPCAPATKTTSSNVYIVRWTRETKIEGWDYEGLNEIETCGGTEEEAVQYVKDELFAVKGLDKDLGSYSCFADEASARAAVVDCLASLVETVRRGVREATGLTAAGLARAKKTDELVEKTTAGGIPGVEVTEDVEEGAHISPSCREAIHGVLEHYTIYFSKVEGDDCGCIEAMHSCDTVATHVSVWVEKMNIVQ